MTVASGRAGTFRWDAGRVLMLITLCTGQLIASIDVTVVNVALPAISSGLASTTRTCSGPCLPTPCCSAAAAFWGRVRRPARHAPGLHGRGHAVHAGVARLRPRRQRHRARRRARRAGLSGGALGLAGVSAVVASRQRRARRRDRPGVRRLRRSPRRCRAVLAGPVPPSVTAPPRGDVVPAGATSSGCPSPQCRRPEG